MELSSYVLSHTYSSFDTYSIRITTNSFYICMYVYLHNIAHPNLFTFITSVCVRVFYMESIKHRTVEVNGINMHIAEKGKGPIVLFLHGFPELWYTWSHQILALADLGYHAVAPDLRGYGDTDAPPSATNYTCLHVVGDVVELIDSLGGR